MAVLPGPSAIATTAEVVTGLTIRQQQAEAWLQSDAAEAAHAQFVAEKPVVVAAAEPEVELASQPIQLLNAVCHHRELPQLQRSLTAEQLSVFPAAFRAPVVAPAATRPTNESSTGQGCRICFASTCQRQGPALLQAELGLPLAGGRPWHRLVVATGRTGLSPSSLQLLSRGTLPSAARNTDDLTFPP